RQQHEPEQRRERVDREVIDGADLVEVRERQIVDRRRRLQHELEGEQSEPDRDQPPYRSKLATAQPVQTHDRREELDVRGQRHGPRPAERGQERDQHLRLADRERPSDRQRQERERPPGAAIPPYSPDRENETPDHREAPERRDDFVWQQRQRPEEDRQ